LSERDRRRRRSILLAAGRLEKLRSFDSLSLLLENHPNTFLLQALTAIKLNKISVRRHMRKNFSIRLCVAAVRFSQIAFDYSSQQRELICLPFTNLGRGG
jgi:hypothetical protein